MDADLAEAKLAQLLNYNGHVSGDSQVSWTVNHRLFAYLTVGDSPEIIVRSVASWDFV